MSNMKEKEKIILIGGGGHTKVLIELIRISGKYEIAGILDSRVEKVLFDEKIPVLGDDSMLPGLKADGVKNACIAVGSIRDNSRRERLFRMVKDSGFFVPCLIHPASIVSESGTSLSEGVQIMAGAIVQTGSTIGGNSIINTGAIVEHDCKIGRNVHICPGAVVCGGSTVGDNSFVGAGATVIQGIEIGEDSVIGAGTLVIKNVMDRVLVKGTMAE